MSTATRLALGRASADELRLRLSLAGESFVSGDEAREALIEAYEDAACRLLAGDWISAENESFLASYVAELNLSDAECNRNGTQERIRMSAQLRQIATEPATLNDWRSTLGSLPLRLSDPDERVVWAFRTVRVEFGSTQMRESDSGRLVMTNRRLYFAGREGSHQSTLGRIHTLRREYDGFAIHTGASAKAYSFRSDVNGWFAWKLINLLVKMK
ncbi:MAG: hypothetical protein OYI31_00390 [Chloroflexota bacterium]|nr:hypothetical protein [Chloroflexota bacterium]MDE2942030.1 hypothetical protein [Chloroflexota bacterium]MDE3266912.1 hypothetical protein [Chloroflexota bacterium]